MLQHMMMAIVLFSLASASPPAGIQHKVKCSTSEMTVEMILDDNVTDIYLEGMKQYGKDIGCQPKVEANAAVFRLSIVDFDRCGLTKVIDRSTGHRVYYHRIVVESGAEKEVRLVKCGFMPLQRQNQPQDQSKDKQLSRTQRDLLADDFVEDEEYDLTIVVGRAPEPILGIVVRQNGQVIGDDLHVRPGTLLQMDVFLDDNSTSTYGLRVSYMDVTDRKTKEETIILNGCSVDPYLFENFNTLDGDTLTARFKAFKFPETNFVLFRGTIDVCLDTCSGVECSNNQVAFGRKRRDVNSSQPSDFRKDRVFEVSMTAIVKLDEQQTLKKDVLGSSATSETVQQPLAANQQQSTIDQSEPQPEPEPKPQPKPKHQHEPNSANALQSAHSFVLILTALFFSNV